MHTIPLLKEARTILSLYDYSGAWSKPWREAGYDVVQIDIKHGHDVRLLGKLNKSVYGILAAPPCTHLAASGARWWPAKGESALLDALSTVDAVMRLVVVHQPHWWVLENPKGRLSHFLGEPTYTFNPCDFGDPWTKRTLLWGVFNPPVKNPVAPRLGSVTLTRRGAARSVTPPGFAQAFFQANDGWSSKS